MLAEQTAAAVDKEESLFDINGFHVIRGLFDPKQALEDAKGLRASIDTSYLGKSISDGCNRAPYTNEYLFRPEIQAAAQALRDQPRFLQVCDVQLDHNRDNWHRDSACRTFGMADWDESRDKYLCYKLIVYLECGHAGLGVLPGSHRSKVKVQRTDLDDFLIIDRDQEVDRPYVEDNSARQLLVGMGSGDALLFDERLLHCGRRYDDKGKIAENFIEPKSTIAYVFGGEDRHSWRFYSFFRYLRPELKYRDFDPEFRDRLKEHGMLPDFYQKDLFALHPDEREQITGK